MYQKLKNKQKNLLIYLILLTFVNSISSSSISDSNNDSSLSKPASTSSSTSTNVNKDDQDEVLPKQLFAHYRESYITKEDAKKFRQRIHAQKKPYTDRDYDDLIHELDFKPKKSKKVAADIYDKKYFDYLPAEDDSEMVEKKHHDKKSSKKHSKHHQNQKMANKKRSRRDTLNLEAEAVSGGDENKDIVKRQTNYQMTQQFLNSERSGGYYYPVPANPWTSHYYQANRPYVNRHYLPVPVYVVPQLQPFGQYPPSTPHHNVAHPPVNPPPNTQIVTESPMDLGNRFGDPDELDDDRPVWEFWDINEPNSIQVNNPTKPPPTRRPPPSILRTTTPASALAPGVTQRIPTRRPAPPIIRNPNKNVVEETKTTSNTLNAVNSGSGSTASRGPELGPAFQSETRPPPSQSASAYEPQGTGPSRCVWGIISCCKRGNLALRYNCFENLGCGGAFWDYNPCSELVFDAALEETNKHFDI